MSSHFITGAISPVKVGKGLKIIIAAQAVLKEALQLEAQINWLQDFEMAKEQAAGKSGSQTMGAQLVMAFFTGSDWCPYCQALTTEVFQDTGFRIWFNQRFMVPFMADFPESASQSVAVIEQNQKLYKQYNITAFPTVVAIKVSPGYCKPDGTCVINESEVGRVVGYMPGSGVDSWIASFSAAANIQ